MLRVDDKGQVMGYHKHLPKEYEDLLINNTSFEIGEIEKDKYGYLERENRVYYFKLNAKIGLIKR